MIDLCFVAHQGLSSLNGKRSATGVNTDDNGLTFARTPGQVSAAFMACTQTAQPDQTTP